MAAFTRSMLLSQGQFAAFLNAKPSDRAELLEELTGTEIYGQISAMVFEKQSRPQRAEKVQAQASGALLLSEEQQQRYSKVCRRLLTKNAYSLRSKPAAGDAAVAAAQQELSAEASQSQVRYRTHSRRWNRPSRSLPRSTLQLPQSSFARCGPDSRSKPPRWRKPTAR
jgi:exonuclease SbcC